MERNKTWSINVIGWCGKVRHKLKKSNMTELLHKRLEKSIILARSWILNEMPSFQINYASFEPYRRT